MNKPESLDELKNKLFNILNIKGFANKPTEALSNQTPEDNNDGEAKPTLSDHKRHTVMEAASEKDHDSDAQEKNRLSKDQPVPVHGVKLGSAKI